MAIETIIPSSPTDIKKIKDVVKEISNSMTRIEAEREYKKEAVKALCEEFQISPKDLNAMIKHYHKNSYDRLVASTEEFQTLYETVILS